MGMLEWAKSELNRLGKDEMQEIMNRQILEIVELFVEHGHSGLSAPYAVHILEKLLMWKPITPLTGEEGEWGRAYGKNNTQQNIRCSSVFRENYDNKTAHDVDGKIFSDNGKTWYSGKGSATKVIFPYDAPVKPKKVYRNKKELKDE